MGFVSINDAKNDEKDVRAPLYFSTVEDMTHQRWVRVFIMADEENIVFKAVRCHSRRNQLELQRRTGCIVDGCLISRRRSFSEG